MRSIVRRSRPCRTLLFGFVWLLASGTDFASGQQPPSDLMKATDVFAPQRILEISIEVKDEDWQSLCNQTRDFLQALGEPTGEEVFTYFPADITIDGKRIENVGIRKKGFLGSLDSVRPSLKIKFDEYKDQKVAAGFDRLTLNNNKQDPSRLCQYLSYKFFNETGYVAPRCNFAKVTVNGKYLGIYSNVESIGKDFLEDRFSDGSGPLYEGTATDLVPGYVERLEAKNKAAKHKEVGQLAELMNRETYTLSELEQLLDVEIFVRFWATESLIGFWDGYNQNQNNYFIYQVPKTEKLQFIPWGLDAAFMESIPLPQLRTANQSVYAHSVLANRLYRRPEIQELYLECMQQLLAEHWDEDALLADVDELASRLRDDSGADHFSFDRRVAEIKTFIRGRRATIEKELESGSVSIKHGVRRPIEIRRVGSVSGSFATQWNARPPSAPTNKGEVELRVEVLGEVMEFSKLGVTSEPSQDPNTRESDGTSPPTVTFHGIRKSDEKQWLLVVLTNNAAFRPSSQPSQVSGMVIEGNPLWFFAKMMMGAGNMDQFLLASGTATFDQAAREVGAAVSGQLDLEIGRFQGGDYLPVR